MLTIEFKKTDKRAVTPTKAHETDIGFDLTAIDIYKKLNDNVVLFETGIIVNPPKGYYTEIVPRSSISKTGYILANSVGIIDPHYRGSLKIPVRFIDDDLPPPLLPFCKFQLILRKIEECTMKEVKEDFNITDRGSGGFGSSDKQNDDNYDVPSINL